MSATAVMNGPLRRITPITIARPESTASLSEPAEPRYPKRKRADVQYHYEEDEYESDSELEYIPVKRQRTTKPLPKHKIFPFMSLPAELRNRIYEECLPSPTKMPEKYKGDKEAIWFGFRQRFYRRTVEYIPSLEEQDVESLQYGRTYFPRSGTQRGFTVNPAGNDDNESDSDAEGEHDAGEPTLGFNILSVCTQIYDEAAPMMYARTLVFADVDALLAFATMLSPRTAKLVRSIEIRNWSQSRSRKSRAWNAFAMLAAKGVTNLTSLFINCKVGWFYSYSWRSQRKVAPIPKKIARKVYRDCHLWLEAMGAANGDLYKGVEVLKLTGDMFEGGRAQLWEDVPEEDRNIFKKELRRLLRAGAW